MRFLIAAVLTCSVVSVAANAQSQDQDWSYHGANGPAHWANLSAEYHQCSGLEQSPVDVGAASITAEIAPPSLYWQPAEVTRSTHAGHTFKIELHNAGKLVLGDEHYVFSHLNFRVGSEHTINGHRFPLEVQLFHAAEDGRIAAVSIFFVEGEENPALRDLISTLPGQKGYYMPDMMFDLNRLRPRSWKLYRYAGSLTTPPCSQNVLWTVFETPLTASADQLAVFHILFSNTFRPIQPIGRRFVLKSR